MLLVWLMYNPLGGTLFLWFSFALLAGLLLGSALAGLVLGGLWGRGLGVLLASLRPRTRRELCSRSGPSRSRPCSCGSWTRGL